jgi:hypothetical protein
LERNCDLEGKIMTVLEASRSTNARADDSAALRPGQLDLARVPASEEAHEKTFRDLLPPGTHGHRDELERGDGPANPTSLKVTTRRILTVTEGRLPPW